MGWFSADEIVAAPTIGSENVQKNAPQTVAICVIAIVAVGYVLIKGFVKLHRHHTERCAEQAARREIVRQNV